jgi:hypothetical protein
VDRKEQAQRAMYALADLIHWTRIEAEVSVDAHAALVDLRPQLQAAAARVIGDTDG